MNRFFTIPNILSITRIFLIIPIGYFLINEAEYHRIITASLIIFAVATDFLDGMIARKWHQITDYGKIIDPLADKVAICIYAVLLVYVGDIPLWYAVLIFARDLLIMFGAIFIMKKKKIVPQSNWLGKIYVSIVAVVFFLASLRIESLELLKDLTMLISVILLVWSSFVYANRLFIGRTVGDQG